MSNSRIVFKALVFALAGAVLVYLGVGMLLANEWRVETQRTIRATPARVAAVVTDLGTWEKWSLASVNLGPQTTRSVVGAPGAAGQQLVWQGPRGKSVLELTRVDADGIDYSFRNELVDAPEAPQVLGGGQVRWSAAPDGCLVTWSDHGRWDHLAGRWIGWFGALQERMKQVEGASLEALDEFVQADERRDAASGGEAPATRPPGASGR